MVYQAYLEGYSNGIFHRLETNYYKQVRNLNKGIAKICQNKRMVLTGWVKYRVTTLNPSFRYHRDNYTVADRFNAKTFFDFWSEVQS